MNEKLIAALRCDGACGACAHWDGGDPPCPVMTDAASALEALQKRLTDTVSCYQIMLKDKQHVIDHLREENEHIRQNSVCHAVYKLVVEERDAAVKDILCDDHCDVCVHSREGNCNCEEADFDCLVCTDKSCTCRDCRDENKWAWRGKETT